MVIRETTGVDPRPWFRCPFSAGDDDPRVLSTWRRSATGTWAPTSCSRTGSPADGTGDGRRRPVPHAGASGTAPSCCSTPGRRARSTRCPRSSTASGRPGRRSSASTSWSGSPREATSSSPSTAATRRPTSRCARPGGAARGGPRPDDVAPGRGSRAGARPAVRAARPDPRRGGAVRLGRRGARSPSSPCAAWRDSTCRPTSCACAGVRRARRLAGETLLFNDTFAALRAGTPDGWGVAVICGSGMNAVGRAPDGRVARFAGLGEIAGDRGGGSGLGMWGLGAAVRAVDGRGPATTLSALVPAHFGLDEPAAVTEALYCGPDRRRPGRGAGAGRCPGRPGRRRGGDRPGRRHRGRDRGLRDGVDPAAGPGGRSGPGDAGGRAGARRRGPARAARDGARSRASRRAPRSRCSTHRPCWARRCSGSIGWRPATTRRWIGCVERSSLGMSLFPRACPVRDKSAAGDCSSAARGRCRPKSAFRRTELAASVNFGIRELMSGRGNR